MDECRIIVAQKKRVALTLNSVCLVYLVFPLLINTIETMKIALIVLVIGVYLYEVQGHAAMNIPPSKWSDQIIIMARVVLYHPRRRRRRAARARAGLPSGTTCCVSCCTARISV